MKRWLELAVIFVVLSTCAPSYGYFLIYNVSGSVKGVNNGTKASIPWKGYFVADLNDSNDAAMDANLIMYGQDSNKRKVYVVLNYSDPNHYLNADAWWQGDYTIFNFWAYHTPFDFEGLTIGLAKEKNIGLADMKYVAGSMTGTMMMWNRMLFDADDNIAGTGNISASLYAAETTYVNQNHWTQTQILEGNGARGGLIQQLRGKGYVAATLPTADAAKAAR
jgi:hypothetical protein